MNINIGPKGDLEIDNARIIFRNLEGRGGLYNREGDRSFALVVPDEEARDALIEQGYNVKTKAPRDADEEPLMYLTIKDRIYIWYLDGIRGNFPRNLGDLLTRYQSPTCLSTYTLMIGT